MKLQKKITATAILFMILLIFSSCKTNKRRTIPCPSFGEYNTNKELHDVETFESDGYMIRVRQ